MNYERCITILENTLNDLTLDREALYKARERAQGMQDTLAIRGDIIILDAKIALIEKILTKCY